MLKETVVNEEFRNRMSEFRKKPDGQTLLQACSGNVVLFSKYMLGLELYSWQVDFLTRVSKAVNKETDKREFLALTSRQIGKSTAVAIFSLWATLFNKYPGTIHNNTIVGIVSASDQQSKKLLDEIKKLIITGDRHLQKTYPETFKDKFMSKLISKDRANNTSTISFEPHKPIHGDYLLKGSINGSVIKSYPPTSVVLGETFTIVIVDEAGKTDRVDDAFFYDYVYPTGNSTDAIRIYTSTPWTPSGFFYRLADPHDEFGNSPAERLLFSIEAIKEENKKYYDDVIKTIEQMNSDGKTSEVQRAYYCRFVKGEKSYFDPKKVTLCFEDYPIVESFSEPCDLGIDFGGQVTSKTVITISSMSEDGLIRRLYHKSYEVGKDDSLLDDVLELKTRFNVQRIIPDDCPAGYFLIRKMVEKGWNIHPMNFRSDKVKKYGAFRSTLNREKIKSYKDDNLKTEMLALEFAEGSRQSLIQHAPGYTDDLIDSFLLSCYFFVEDESAFKYHNWSSEEDE